MASSAYGTKPSQLASPVPQDAPVQVSAPPPSLAANPAPGAPAGLSPDAQDISNPTAVPTQMAEGQPAGLTQDMKDYGQYLQAHGADPSEISEYLQYLAAHAPPEKSPLEAQSENSVAAVGGDMTAKVGDPSAVYEKAGQAADFLGGHVRATIAQGIGSLKGKQIVTKDDIDKMSQGKGPTTSEYLERLGVPEGKSVTIPFTDTKVSQRDVAGFAGDIMTDPLTFVGKLTSGLPKAFESLRGITGLGANASAEQIGKAIYKSGFSKIDAKMVENGAEPLSKVLLEEGAPSGTTAQVQKKVQAMADNFGKLRDGLYSKASELGAKVDMAYQPLEKSEEFIANLAKDSREDVAKQADELRDYLQRNYKNTREVDLATLSQWKTDLYNTLPQSFFNPNGKMTPVGKQFNAVLAQDFRQLILDEGNKVQKGLGDSIEAINSKWGTLLDARKPVAQQVKQAAGKPIVGPMKAAVTAINPAAGVALEAADLANTTVVKTKVGKTLVKAGQTGIAGDIARRSAINKSRSGK